MNWLKELIITLICKYWDKNNSYPTCVIPYFHYKYKIDINHLICEDNCVIVRRSDKSEEESFNDLDILREDIISESDVPNLSMNLYGGKFNNTHLKFRCVRPATDLWNGEKIKISKYRTFYLLLDTYSPIYFLIKDLHNKEFPYYKTDDKETKKLLTALNLSTLSENGKVKLNGKSFVEHTPTKLNYWHVELQIKDVQDSEIKHAKSAWQKSAAEYAYKDIITMSARKRPPNPIYKIPAYLYIK